ncbi:MAG: helix-turn-helix domain-containing protein [Lachnospiraceae bacterium]
MSLGENLQFLRKKHNITQEQLAEQLEVSRQSVSKWESDSSYPEMDKILQLCNLFHCGVDDLVQKDISQLYVEDKTNYDDHYNEFSKFVSLGIGIIILGLSAMCLLYGMNYFFIDEVIKEDFSGILFLIFVVIGVAILILFGIRNSDFKQKNPFIVNFYKEKEIDDFNRKFSVMVTVGVSLYIIDAIILLSAETIFPDINSNEYLESLFASIFFLIIAIATMIIVYAVIQKDKYNIDKYNQLNNKSSETYKKESLNGTVCGCIMMITTIIYLLISFIKGEWGMPTVVVFAVGGICCGIASSIINHMK